MTFEDGSVFALPPEWAEVFVASFDPNPQADPRLESRWRFVVAKYMEHQAWPSKFDGFGEEGLSEAALDDPDYYAEHWEEWGAKGLQWGDRIIYTPTQADVAEAVLYQEMRPALLQKALNTLAKAKDVNPPSVVTPEQFLKLLKSRS